MENKESLDTERQRRSQLRRIPFELLRQRLAEYTSFPDNQPVTERHVAARLQKSRAWVQMKRVTGGGPRFHRTDTGKILYLKKNIEAYLAVSLTAFDSTSQYPAA